MDHNVSDLNYSNPRFSVFEGLSVKFTPAPLLKRIFAYLIDLSIIITILYPLMLIFSLVIMGSFSTVFFLGSSLQIMEIIMVVFAVACILFIYHGYFIYYEYKKGTTLGKRLFGLQVVPTLSSRLSMGQCILRDFFRYIDCALILPGLLSIVITKRHQRLGDLLAGTLVTYSKSRETQSQFIYLTQEQYFLFRDTLNPGELPREVCKAYLNFSYPAFIGGKKKENYPTPYLAQWEEIALRYIPQAKNHALDQTTLLLFFAEYCLQTLNAKR